MRVPLPRTSHCDRAGFGVRARLTDALIAGITGIFFITQAIANPGVTSDHNENKKIHIKADKVIADIDTGETEFLGHVRMSQGNMIVTAERMIIYYQQDLVDKNHNAVIKESIKKIIATGNVRINFDNSVAFTEEAVYVAETQVLVLSGNNSKLISGADSITGSKFTFYRTDENIIVEGRTQNQVKAVFYTADKSLF